MHPAEARAQPAVSPGETLPARAQGRLVSLDALRGFDMIWIIGGAELVRAFAVMTGQSWLVPQMEHIDWAGLHFYDLIFPLFIFIVGVSLVFSLSKTIAQHGRGEALKRIVRRSVLLYLLGFIFSGGFSHPWPELHFAGVLQRIAAAYFFAALLFCFFSRRALIAWCVALLVGYDAVMTFVPMRDIHLDKATFDQIAARTGEKDPMKIFLGATHWVRGQFTRGYNVANQVDFLYLPGFKGYDYFDPDGLLSTIPVVATCLLGVFAGLLFRSTLTDRLKLFYLVLGGVILLNLGLVWALHFPIVKRLWSPSYVLVSGGISAMALAAFYWLIDIAGFQRWCRPFVWVGMNSITIYFTKCLVDYTALGSRLTGGSIQDFFNAHLTGLGDFLTMGVGLGLALWLCRFLYVRKVFLRL
jgi:predicted acyltransferase